MLCHKMEFINNCLNCAFLLQPCLVKNPSKPAGIVQVHYFQWLHNMIQCGITIIYSAISRISMLHTLLRLTFYNLVHILAILLLLNFLFVSSFFCHHQEGLKKHPCTCSVADISGNFSTSSEMIPGKDEAPSSKAK